MADTEFQKSSRDPAALKARLERWLDTRLGGAGAVIENVSSPSANGMSSETLLFDARWKEGGATVSAALVARVEPDLDDVPVFPSYDLEAQFKTLQLVAGESDVPVPQVRWLETDREALGAPFFVMDRVAGRVPPDVMPYTMDSWLLTAGESERRHLQNATVGVLARLHAIPVAGRDFGFLEFDVPGATPMRRHYENQKQYYEFMREGRTFPIIERAFEWLEANWPDDEATAVISWGDSRIGNVMYDGFDPVAVLDWEMAAVGPRELDIAWMIFLHIFFQDITEQAGMPGLPEFMRRADVVAEYKRLTGHSASHMDFYEVYAALRHAIVMARVFARSAHFDGTEWPEQPDDVIYHRNELDRMLRGEFRS